VDFRSERCWGTHWCCRVSNSFSSTSSSLTTLVSLLQQASSPSSMTASRATSNPRQGTRTPSACPSHLWSTKSSSSLPKSSSSAGTQADQTENRETHRSDTRIPLKPARLRNIDSIQYGVAPEITFRITSLDLRCKNTHIRLYSTYHDRYGTLHKHWELEKDSTCMASAWNRRLHGRTWYGTYRDEFPLTRWSRPWWGFLMRDSISTLFLLYLFCIFFLMRLTTLISPSRSMTSRHRELSIVEPLVFSAEWQCWIATLPTPPEH